MGKIRVLIDRHFPYDRDGFNSRFIETKKVHLFRFLPKPLCQLYHILELYVKSFSADVILGNRRTALLLGLLFYIYKPKHVALIGYEIIFNFKNNFRNKLVITVWKLAVKNIDRLIVQTSGERSYLAEKLNTSLAKFKTIPFYTENEPYIGPCQNGYIFAAGRMERDFETLMEAIKDTDIPVVIVAGESQKQQLEKYKKPNIQFYFNIPKLQYLHLLQKSKLVVVPLKKGMAARGQVVLLEAMKYGKPVICSNVPGTIDYVKDKHNGLLVEPQNPEELRDVILTYFNNKEALDAIAKTAHHSQQQHYSPEVFFKNYQRTIKEVVAVKREVTEGKIIPSNQAA